jgi:hypothetical protein
LPSKVRIGRIASVMSLGGGHAGLLPMAISVWWGRVCPHASVQREGSRGSGGDSLISEANLGSARCKCLAVTAGTSAATFFNGIHSGASSLLESAPPFLFGPTRAGLVVDQSGDVQDFKVAISLVFGHGKHERSLVKGAGNQPAGTAV